MVTIERKSRIWMTQRGREEKEGKGEKKEKRKRGRERIVSSELIMTLQKLDN